MKNISVFQLVVMIVFVAIAGIGLFMFATYSGSSTAVTNGPVVIWGTLPKEAIDAVIGGGEKNGPFATVSYIQKQPESFVSEYINAAAAGDSPDLLLVSSDEIMALQHTLSFISYESVPERSFRDAFIDGAQALLSPEGLYAFPVAIDPLVLYYNRALLSSAGIAEPPRTWEAVGAMVPDLAIVSGGQTVSRAGIALGGYSNIEHAREILTAFFLQAGVPLADAKLGGQRNTFLTGGSGVPPAEAALRYYTAFANPAQTTYTWNSTLPNSRALFVSGDLALYIGFGSEYASLKQANPNLDFDVARMPQPGTAQTRSTYGTMYVFALPKTSKNPAGALTAAFAFGPTEAARSFIGAAGTLAPVRRDLIAAGSTNPVRSVVYAEALVARPWLSPDAGTVDAIFGAMISNVTTGRTRYLEALSAAERALSAAYAE